MKPIENKTIRIDISDADYNFIMKIKAATGLSLRKFIQNAIKTKILNYKKSRTPNS